MTMQIKSAEVIDDAVIIKLQDDRSFQLEDCWLRDHCRCTVCYHADTFQRSQHMLDIPESKIVNLKFDKYQLKVTWDDSHVSTYGAEFLAQFHYDTWKESRKFRPQLWSGDEVSKKVAKVTAQEFLHSRDGAKAVFQSLLDHGVALIQDVGVSVEDTEEICKALGGVQHTIFGGMWKFTTRADHADTAYTNLPLAVHNDNTYFTEAAGLQILHCLEHTNGTGGNTLLVDGFHGAASLKRDHPDDFDFLTTFNVEAEYIEEGHHHKYSAPVIQIDSDTGDVKQIRFNVYDRSAMAFADKNECRRYYKALKNLARYYQDSSNQWQFKLTPGTVMAMDNFRVLHGRTSFTGYRVLCGSYVARSDWLDKARSLKLIQ